MKKINKKIVENIKFTSGVVFIFISIIGSLFSIYNRKNYLLDIIQAGTIGIMLIGVSGKKKKQMNDAVLFFLLLLFLVVSIMKFILIYLKS